MPPINQYNTRQITGLLLGPLLFTVILLLPQPADMPANSLQVAAVALLMATFWISEAIPIPATALLPVVLFPLLGVMPTSKVTLAYGNHLIFLFMGGFLIAIAIEKMAVAQTYRTAYHFIRRRFCQSDNSWFYAGYCISFCMDKQYCHCHDDGHYWHSRH